MRRRAGATIAAGDEHHAVFDLVAPGVDWRALEAEHERRYGGFDARDLYDDVRSTLERLRDAGLTVVIAGNQLARRRRQLVDLALPADVIATSDDLGIDKPAPGYFARGVRAAGAPPDRVLHIGDRVDNDVVPARRAGLRTAWLRRGPWGLLQRPPVDRPPDLVLGALGELGDHLVARA